MSKYKVGDRFIFEITEVEEMFGRSFYHIAGFKGIFSENVLDDLKKTKKKKKKKKKKKGGRKHGERKSFEQRQIQYKQLPIP